MREGAERTAIGAAEKVEQLRTRVDKVLEKLQQVEQEAEKKVAERLERMNGKMIHSLDKAALNRQRLEQVKTKYKLRKHDFKKELKRHIRHFEASKKLWNEQMRVLQHNVDVPNRYAIHVLGATDRQGKGAGNVPGQAGRDRFRDQQSFRAEHGGGCSNP